MHLSPRLFLSISASMSLYLCIYVSLSLHLCLSISASMSLYLCVYVSLSPLLCLSISSSMSLYLLVYVSLSPRLCLSISVSMSCHLFQIYFLNPSISRRPKLKRQIIFPKHKGKSCAYSHLHMVNCGLQIFVTEHCGQITNREKHLRLEVVTPFCRQKYSTSKTAQH